MENTIQMNDIDLSNNIYQPIDISTCIIKEHVFDISCNYFREHFEGKEILYGKSVREYYYFSGQQGPPGPPGSISQTFLNVYNETSQTILENNPIIFDTHNSIFGDCTHEPKSSEIFIWKTGYYHIYTNIYPIDGCQFSLYKNSFYIVPGSTIGSISGSTQNSNSIIVQITCEDICWATELSPCGYACKLELVNNTPYKSSITLYDASGLGYTLPQINASILIFLLHD